MAKITTGNPYTHEEHTRESVRNPVGLFTGKRVGSCKWCGQSPQTLYAYDGKQGAFCNKECWRAYYS